MKLYGAIDLHSNNNVTVVIDEQDRVVFQKRLPNDLALIAQATRSLQAVASRHRGGVDLQLVLAGRWPDGQRATSCTWPTPRRSSSTKDSSTPMITSMRAGWRTCCGWEFCPKAISIRKQDGGARSAAQAQPDWCGSERPIVEHPESDYAQHRQFAERQADQGTRCPADRGTVDPTGISPWRLRPI